MKIIRKSIIDISISEKSQIDDFIIHNNGLIFHEISFNEITSNTFKTKLSYFLAFQNKTLIGICPVHIIREKKIPYNYSNPAQYEIPYGGWVYDKKETNLTNLWKKLPSSILSPFIYWSSILDEFSNDISSSTKIFQTGCINLNTDTDNIFTNIIHSKRRNMIKKAKKTGVTIKKYGTDGLSIYFSLMLEMHQKTGLTNRPYQYYERIVEKYFPIGKVIIMIAFIEGKPISGLIIIGNQNIMHYWQGASTIEAPNLGQGEFLQWEAIKWAQDQGSKYYDLCVIEPERLPHIAKFKKGFTKEFVPFYCVTRKPFLFKVINKVQNAFSN